MAGTNSTYNNDPQQREQRAKARWSILRNALLHKAKDEVTASYSIHRFPGYQLLKRDELAKNDAISIRILRELQRVEVPVNPSNNFEQVVDQLEATILALDCVAAASSKNQYRIQLFGYNQQNQKEFLKSSLIPALQDRCASQFQLEILDENDSSNENKSNFALLVDHVPTNTSMTRFSCCKYSLSNDDSHSHENTTVRFLFTREPVFTKLSLLDLVSHRFQGVDNTGNICVWDSERTLAYILNRADTLDSMLPDLATSPESQNILELGTGMAGLSAMALGLRLAAAKEYAQDCRICVTLTDGHADGVKNNRVNQVLTRAYCQSQSQWPSSLVVGTRVLLWTTDLQDDTVSDMPLQDVCLVSDCTHFQNFHAALAITIARSLKVGGRAILCQPHRGDSLENFCLLLSSSSSSSSGPSKSPLFSLKWWTHSVLEEQHEKAVEQFGGGGGDNDSSYEETLHRPRLLILTKRRKLETTDCDKMAQHQTERDQKQTKQIG
jgi:hypothetical protein